MLHVLGEAGESDAELKSSERELVCGYGRKARQGDWKCVMVEYCNSKQGQPEQDEVDGNSQHQYGFDHGGPNISDCKTGNFDCQDHDRSQFLVVTKDGEHTR